MFRLARRGLQKCSRIGSIARQELKYPQSREFASIRTPTLFEILIPPRPVFAIIGLNVLGGAALQYAPKFVEEHAIVSSDDIRHFRRLESLVLSIFVSGYGWRDDTTGVYYNTVDDTGKNIFGLFVVAPIASRVLGGAGFLVSYLTAGVVGNLFHVWSASPHGRAFWSKISDEAFLSDSMPNEARAFLSKIHQSMTDGGSPGGSPALAAVFTSALIVSKARAFTSILPPLGIFPATYVLWVLNAHVLRRDKDVLEYPICEFKVGVSALLGGYLWGAFFGCVFRRPSIRRRRKIAKT